MRLNQLKKGQKAKVINLLGGNSLYRKRLLSLGIFPGTEISIHHIAPLGDPINVYVKGALFTLRKEEANIIEVELFSAALSKNVITNSCARSDAKTNLLLAFKEENRETSTVMNIALIGVPNSGKSTLFNALVGANQSIGNWPGVTVDYKKGYFSKEKINVIDLPGINSLSAPSAGEDERITHEFISNQPVDLIVNVVDATQLERQLYLSLELIELGKPILIVLTKMDLIPHQKNSMDFNLLSKRLGCPVIPIENLKNELAKKIYPPAFPTYSYTTHNIEDRDMMRAEARYHFISSLIKEEILISSFKKSRVLKWIDSIVLNRVLGIPIFFSVMYLLFFFSMNIGGAFQDFFDITSQTIFVDGLAVLLNGLGLPNSVIALLANGVGQGLNTVLTFVPVIAMMFLGLAFLEESGYMARAVFIVDRLMRFFGLPGKSFVPMIIGFGCNVPAVMAARTLENKRDRILTIMMTPFMSCSARLATYAVFTAAFFPTGGQNIVFLLYLVGIIMAVFTGWLLQKTTLKGKPAPLIMELPDYQLPAFKTLVSHAFKRLNGFIYRAGKLILPICMVLGMLNALTINGALSHQANDAHSILSQLGQWITPLFAPMGMTAENWPATVSLLTGILAKEVIVGTLNSLYSQMGHLGQVVTHFHFWTSIKTAFASIPLNLSHLGTNPLTAKIAQGNISQSVYGIMVEKFQGTKNAIAYLLFVLLYFPCVSTVAVMWREIGRTWTMFSVIWTTVLAYSVSVAFYQVSTFTSHPLLSTFWIGSLIGIFVILFLILTFIGEGRNDFNYSKNIPLCGGKCKHCPVG